MPNEPISALDPVVEVLDRDLFVLVQNGTTQRCTAGQLRAGGPPEPDPGASFTLYRMEAIPPRTFAGGQDPILPGSAISFTMPLEAELAIHASWEIDQVWETGFVSSDLSCVCFVSVDDGGGIGTGTYGFGSPVCHAGAPAGNALGYASREVLYFCGFTVVRCSAGPVTVELGLSIGIAPHNGGFNRVAGAARLMVVVPQPLVLPFETFITEDGEVLITEDGEVLITEGFL